MAKSPDGILGAFSGKAGNIVGYTLNGQALFRSRPKKRKKPRKPTPLEANNRSKMKLLTTFFSFMPKFLKFTFTPESRGTLYNWYNLAVKYNNPHAIKGTFPNLEIDYPKVVLSRGELKQPVNARVERTSEGVKFSWDVMKGDEYNEDHVMVLVYSPHNHSTAASMGDVRRHIGTETITMPQEDFREKFEAYICFVSNDRQEFSDSLHIASVDALPEDGSTQETLEKTQGSVKSEKIKAELSPEEISKNKALDVARNLKTLKTISDIDIANATGLTVNEVETCLDKNENKEPLANVIYIRNKNRMNKQNIDPSQNENAKGRVPDQHKTGLDAWNERLDNNLEPEEGANQAADENAADYSDIAGSGDQSDQDHDQ